MVTQPNTTLQSGKYRILRTSERHENLFLDGAFKVQRHWSWQCRVMSRRNEEKAVLRRVGEDKNGYWEVLLDIDNVV